MNNKYADLIYNKPIVIKTDNLFKRVYTRIKQKEYYRKNIKPVIKELRTKDISFEDMMEFTDFIRVLEQVFFYNNDTRFRDGEKVDVKLLSDSKYGAEEKVLILFYPKEKVTVKFTLYNKNANDDYKDSYIKVYINAEFGKKITTQYIIKNEEFDSDMDKHQYNLFFNINHQLKKSMATLFEEYYKYSIILED